MENKKYNVMYYPSFNNELSEIINYLIYELNNKNAAIKLVNELQEKINLIAKFPTLFVAKAYNEVLMYKFNIQNYSIFYSIEDSNILICHIFYSKRDFTEIIK